MPTVVGVSLALGASGAGFLAQLAAVVEPAVSSGSDLAPWLQGGGSAAAVAGLVYVARMIAKGELVPRPVRDAELELGAAILAAGQREAKVLQVAEVQQQQQAANAVRQYEVVRLLTIAERSLADVATEMEYWREMRDRGTRREDGPAKEDRR